LGETYLVEEIREDINEEIIAGRVEVVLFLDFEDESEKALHTAWEVAEELLDKENIWVDIVPIHVWVTDPIGMEYPDLPKIVINGKTRFIGRAPSREELIDAIKEGLNEKGYLREKAFITAARIWDQGFLAAAII
jgi:hypothetical protein